MIKLLPWRRFKDDVKEVAEGYECGVTLEHFNDVKEGDVFESYIMEEYRRGLSPNNKNGGRLGSPAILFFNSNCYMYCCKEVEYYGKS